MGKEEWPAKKPFAHQGMYVQNLDLEKILCLIYTYLDLLLSGYSSQLELFLPGNPGDSCVIFFSQKSFSQNLFVRKF